MALPSVAACPGQNIKLGFEAWLKARYCTCPACGTGLPSFVPMLVASVSLLRADAPSPTVRFMYCKGNQGHVGPHLLTPGSGLRSIPILAQHLRSLALVQWGLQSLTGALPQLGVGVDSCPPAGRFGKACRQDRQPDAQQKVSWRRYARLWFAHLNG